MLFSQVSSFSCAMTSSFGAQSAVVYRLNFMSEASVASTNVTAGRWSSTTIVSSRGRIKTVFGSTAGVGASVGSLPAGVGASVGSCPAGVGASVGSLPAGSVTTGVSSAGVVGVASAAFSVGSFFSESSSSSAPHAARQSIITNASTNHNNLFLFILVSPFCVCYYGSPETAENAMSRKSAPASLERRLTRFTCDVNNIYR